MYCGNMLGVGIGYSTMLTAEAAALTSGAAVALVMRSVTASLAATAVRLAPLATTGVAGVAPDKIESAMRAAKSKRATLPLEVT
jgi:hypothetical protein